MGPKEAYPEPIERAYVVCFDHSTKFWEVCGWSSKEGRWVRPDGGAPQFSPSSWVTCSGDAGTKNAEILNVFAGAQPILTAPKSGAIIILLNDISRAWEVGYWSSGIFNWTQIDGKPLRICPTHWAPATSNCSDTTAEYQYSAAFACVPSFPLVENGLAPPLTRRANLGRGFVAIAALIGLLVAGHTLRLLGDFGELRPSQTEIVTSVAGRDNKDLIDEISSIDHSAGSFGARIFSERDRADSTARDLADTTAEASARPEARMEVAQLAKLLEENEKIWAAGHDAERERADGIARDLATVREELAGRIAAEASARMDVDQLAKLLDANEKEWTTRLNSERERSDGIVRDLATVRAELAGRIAAEASARMDVDQLAKLLDANGKEWTTRLNAERERSDGIARDLATVRAELADRITAEASARMDVAQLARLLAANEKEWTTRLNAERERSDGIARDLATVRAELADRTIADASPRNDLTTNIKTGSAMTDRPRTVTVRDPLRMTIDRGDNSISTIVASAADEAKLIARAQFLIRQGDVAGARRFLERAFEGGSARAAYLLAETYDWQILRAQQVYGARGDTQRALELYGVASQGGIDKAKERISALKGAEGP